MKSKPDYAFAQQGAYDLIYESNIKELPISMKEMVTDVVGLKLLTYTELSEKTGLNVKEVCDLYGSPDGVIMMSKTGKVKIAYNDTIESEGRMRFTLAHEIGHYKLGHFEETDKLVLSRSDLTEEEYDVLEKEANYFAKRLLAPIPLVDDYVEAWHKISPKEIAEIFNTSLSFGKNLVNELIRRRDTTNISRVHHDMNVNFQRFIYMDTQMVPCDICQNLVDINHNFCQICGSGQLDKNTRENYHIRREDRLNTMNYSKINVTTNGYAVRCPHCDNENIAENQEYCQVCSTYLRNKCIGEVPEGMASHEIYFHVAEGCGYIDSSGDARFCPQCGGDTSFGFNNTLRNWDEEQKNNVAAYPWDSNISASVTFPPF